MKESLPSEPLGSKLLKKGFWLYLLTLFSAPLGYLVKVLVSRDLSVEDLGVLYGAVSLVTILWAYNDLGFSESLNFFLPKRVIAKDHAGVTRLAAYAMGMQVLSSSIAGGAIWWFSEPISQYLFHSASGAGVLRVFSVFLVAHGFLQVPSVIFNAVQDVKANKGLEIIRMGFTLAFAAGLFASGLGSLEAYAWVWVAGMGVGVAGGWSLLLARHGHLFDRRGLTWDRAVFTAALGFAVWSVLANNIGTLLSQLDMLFVSRMLGRESAGLYTNYLSLMHIPFFVIGPAVAFLFPVVSEMNARGDVVRTAQLRALAYRHLSVAAAYASAFFLAFGPSMAVLFFGEPFRASGAVVAFSAPFLVFNFLLQANFMFLSGTGRPRARMGILLAGLGLNVATLPFLLDYVSWTPSGGFQWGWGHGMGLAGAALASGLGWILLFFLSHRAARQFPAKFPFAAFAANAAAAGACAYAASAWVPPFSGLPSLVAPMALAGLLMAACWGALNWAALRPLLALVRKPKPAATPSR